MSRRSRRKAIDVAMRAACLVLAVLAAVPLVLLVLDMWRMGHASLSWDFLTSLPKRGLDLAAGRVTYGGGIVHALEGTFLVVGLAALLGAPVGILAGLWLAEFARGRLASLVRTSVDALAGVPSIVAGLVGYTYVASRWGFSGWAAATALAVLMVPVITRTTDEAIRLVPRHLREASLALGAPHTHTILRVVLPNALGGILTGLLLALARAAGETAPVLLTSINGFAAPRGPAEPVPTLPTMIYDYSRSPAPELNDQAQAAALVLVAMVLTVNILVRWASRRTRARNLA